MERNVKDGALFAAAVASCLAVGALTLGVPTLWIAIVGFLLLDATIILFLAIVGKPPKAKERRKITVPKQSLPTRA